MGYDLGWVWGQILTEGWWLESWRDPICAVQPPLEQLPFFPLSLGNSSSKIWDRVSLGTAYEGKISGMTYSFYHCRWSWSHNWHPVSPSSLPHFRVPLSIISTSASPDGLLGKVTQTLTWGSEPLITMDFSGHGYCHLSSKLNKRQQEMLKWSNARK